MADSQLHPASDDALMSAPAAAEIVEAMSVDEQTQILEEMHRDDANAVLDAMARPGTIRRVTGAAPPARLSVAVGTAMVLVTDRGGFALYFSRASIPWDRDLLQNGEKALPIGIVPLRHIGIYAYRVGYLHRYAQMRPSPLEQAEQLEQLRALWYGERIHVAEASQRPGPGVDTEDDLRIVEQLLKARVEGN